ncbi:hypothetical protein TREES_T100021075 [Tupaia chinensis]|uniref:Uncharacterized protein n=1 Tax=Tupaia chinensis TaxID=246437 RepID=L9JAA5_TUPCH|nr:hypothetical protein TREES_T100021075 [Tupaia chinensis]
MPTPSRPSLTHSSTAQGGSHQWRHTTPDVACVVCPPPRHMLLRELSARPKAVSAAPATHAALGAQWCRQLRDVVLTDVRLYIWGWSENAVLRGHSFPCSSPGSTPASGRVHTLRELARQVNEGEGSVCCADRAHARRKLKGSSGTVALQEASSVTQAKAKACTRHSRQRPAQETDMHSCRGNLEPPATVHTAFIHKNDPKGQGCPRQDDNASVEYCANVWLALHHLLEPPTILLAHWVLIGSSVAPGTPEAVCDFYGLAGPGWSSRVFGSGVNCGVDELFVISPRDPMDTRVYQFWGFPGSHPPARLCFADCESALNFKSMLLMDSNGLNGQTERGVEEGPTRRTLELYQLEERRSHLTALSETCEYLKLREGFDKE